MRQNQDTFNEEKFAARVKELAQAKRRATQAEKTVEKLRLLLVSVEKAWHEGQAARLAAALKAGHPCMVCGATKHPKPALAAVGGPSAEELGSLRKELRCASIHYQHARGNLQAAYAHAEAQERAIR